MNSFIPAVWYSSDLFYWVLYAGSFLLKKSNDLDEYNSYNNSQSSVSMQNNNYFDDYFLIFEKISQKLDHCLMLKFGFNMFSLRNIFKVVAFLCMVGASGKFYLNLQSCLSSLNDLILMDEKIAS